jgi:hypothetical protein
MSTAVNVKVVEQKGETLKHAQNARELVKLHRI